MTATPPTPDNPWRAVDELLRRHALPPLDGTGDGDWPLLRTELAARNLGLVQLADPARFAWPGYWLAEVDRAGTRQLVVMYGSPSARLWPADAAQDGTGVIVTGWVLAPFDVSLDPHDPYGAASSSAAGTVVSVHLAERAAAPMHTVDRVAAIAGVGLAGDRYARGAGTFSGPTGYEVTLIERAALDQFDPPLTPAEARRNLVTDGVDLNALVGQVFRVGDATLIGRRLCEPCRHLADLAGRALIRPLVHRGGLRADVLVSGEVWAGAEVVPADAATSRSG